MSIIVNKQHLAEIQQSIIRLADEVSAGRLVDIGRLDDAIVNVCESYAKLNPSNTIISETDKFSLNVEKLTLLQQSILHLADYFEKDRLINVREAERRIVNVCECWANLGKA